MKRTLLIASSLVALAVTGAGLSGIGGPEWMTASAGLGSPPASEDAGPVRRPVLVATVRADRSESVVSLPAVIAPATEETRAFQVNGRLVERLVSLGDIVRRGDVLARLDDSDFQLALQAAEAERAAARAAHEKARLALDRVRSLQTGGWVSTRASDDAEVAFEEARGRFEQARRAVNLARNALDHAVISADADGVVTREFAEPGQVVAPGQPILGIARDAGREAIMAVPEGLVADLRTRRAVVAIWSEDSRVIPARLVELSPIADPVTRTFEARYRLDGHGAAPALGMSATVRLTRTEDTATTEVPLSALSFDAQGPSVWAVDEEGRTERRPVAIVGIGTDTARIASGLSDGERIVVIGVHKIRAGETVRAIQKEG